MLPHDAAALIKSLALDIGFDLVGITRAAPIPRTEYLRSWIAAGNHGSMSYLARRLDRRTDPAQLLPDARSIICTALNYRREYSNSVASTDSPNVVPGAASRDAANGTRIRNHGEADHSGENTAAASLPGRGIETATERPGATVDESTQAGRIAQYARGDDYHVVIHRMLETLIARMRASIATHFEARPFVDTGPLVEREFAASAGLGWIGKNTCVIHPRLGSFTFLGEIITTLDLAPDDVMPDHCGSCTRCLEACPTNAFSAPYEMNASRCISYFTIEQRGEIPPEFQALIGDWLYGCDICQDVCPFNARSPLAVQPEITADRIPAKLPLLPLLNLTSDQHRALTAGTAADRAKPEMWRRNASIVQQNLR